MMGGKLDEATAKQFGLEKTAFQEALKKAMLIQFAKDNGLYVTDKELAKNLISIPAFQKEGKFDKSLYNIFLRNSRLTPKEFEENLKKDILIEKLFKALSLKSTKTTKETLASYMLMQDKISIKTIKAPEISVSEDEIKKFWEKHKEKYKSALSYNIGYFYVAIDGDVAKAEMISYYDEHKQNYTDKDGKILEFENIKDKVKTDLLAKKTKKEAILTMKKLKKGEIEFNKIDNISLTNDYISFDLMNRLVENKFLKPTLTQKGWLIAKLYQVNKPTILTYEKAKEFAKNDLIIEKTKQTLIKLAKDNVENFSGKNVGFIGRDNIMNLKTMSIDEANLFVQNLFNSNKPRGYVLLPNEDNPQKVVLFKIMEQKLLDKNNYEKYKEMITSYSDKLKEDRLNNNLIQKLQKLYEAQIKVYVKI